MVVLLSLPLRPAPLLSIVALSLLLALSVLSIPFGFFTMAILLSWFFKYSFTLLDELVSGAQEMPVLSLEIIYGSIGELRSLLPLILVTIYFFVSGAGQFFLGFVVAVCAGLGLLAVLPAVLAIQGWTGRVEHSLDPRVIRVMIRSLGADYLWIVVTAFALTGAFAVAVEYSAHVWLPVRVGLLIYDWLAVIVLIGGTLRAKRRTLLEEIPLVIPQLRGVSPEELAAEREHWLDSIYASWRSRAEEAAWNFVLERVESRPEGLDELRWLYARVRGWEPARFGNRVLTDLLARLRREKRDAEADHLTQERIRFDPGFRP